MPIDGFRSEWITIGKHRVLLEARASFPDEDHRFIAAVVAKFLDYNSTHARLVKIFLTTRLVCTALRPPRPTLQKKSLRVLLPNSFRQCMEQGITTAI